MTALSLRYGTVQTLTPLTVLLDEDTAATPIGAISAPDPAAFRAALTVGVRVSVLLRPLDGHTRQPVLMGRIATV